MKGQSSVEFMLVVIGVIFFFTMFFVALQGIISTKLQAKYDTALEEIASNVQHELQLAQEAGSGYERIIVLPQVANTANYSISLIAGSVYIWTIDGKHALALPIINTTGMIQKGSNTIKNIDNRVYVNS